MVTTLPALKNLDDKALVGLCQEKSPGAFDELLKRHLKSVYSFIYHYVHNKELAEDLTQDTFVRIYRSIHQFDNKRPLKPWMFTIATNVCKTGLKKNQQAPLLLNDEATERNLLENWEDPKMNIEENLSDDGLTSLLHQALNKLSPSVRQALILRHVYDLPYEEVATVMEANINSVRTWLRRGRDNLKTLLDTNGGLEDYECR